MAQWLSHWPCYPRVSGSISGFSSLSEETVNPSPMTMKNNDKLLTMTYEPPRGKTNNVVFKQV